MRVLASWTVRASASDLPIWAFDIMYLTGHATVLCASMSMSMYFSLTVDARCICCGTWPHLATGLEVCTSAIHTRPSVHVLELAPSSLSPYSHKRVCRSQLRLDRLHNHKSGCLRNMPVGCLAGARTSERSL